MGFKPNCCGVFAFFLSIVCYGLFFLAFGTTHWRTPGGSISSIISGATQDITFGLFQECAPVLGERTCVWISWDPNVAGLTITVTRGILITAAIFILFALLIGFLGLCSREYKMSSQGGLNILVGVFILVGCACYTAMVILVDNLVGIIPQVGDFGYSLYICWATGVLLFIVGIFGLCGDSQANDIAPTAVQAQMVWATTGTADGQRAAISPNGQQRLALVKM